MQLTMRLVVVGKRQVDLNDVDIPILKVVEDLQRFRMGILKRDVVNDERVIAERREDGMGHLYIGSWVDNARFVIAHPKCSFELQEFNGVFFLRVFWLRSVQISTAERLPT
jgi:hypothetical protein